MSIKDYTRGFGFQGPCIAILILIVLSLAVPVSSDESGLEVNESNGPPPIDTSNPQVPDQDNQVIPPVQIPEPEINPLPVVEDTVLPPEENTLISPTVTPVPATMSMQDEPSNELVATGENPDALGQNNPVTVNDPPIGESSSNSTVDPPETTESPGDPVLIEGDEEVNNSAGSPTMVIIPPPVVDLPINDTENSPGIPVPGELNNTLLVNEEIANAGPVLQAVVVNGSTGGNSPAPDSVPICAVNPPWAANLTDPPLNTTNLIPGISAGKMWEINTTTGPGYYPLDMGGLDTLSMIGIWIHDVSDVVLDGLGNNLVGHEGGSRVGSIGVLINGDVSNIQVKNFTAIAGWFDGIVVQSGENITLGDSLHIINNQNSGINVTDSTGLNIIGNIESIGNSNNGILIKNSSDIHISNNIEVRTNGNVGVNITNSSDVTIRDNVNIWDNPAGVVIGNSQDLAILGNINIHNNANRGLLISSTDNVVIGPNSSGYVTISYNDMGIELINVSDARINDTSVLHNTGIGIYSEGSSRILFRNVTAEYNGASIHDAGLRILWADGWHHILESNFTNNWGDGIEVIDSNLTWIQNSTLADNGRNGVGLGKSDLTGGSNDCSVNGSFIYHNSGNGIAIYGSERLEVNNNRINDNTEDGILLFHQIGADIRDNYFSDNTLGGVNATSNSIEINITGNRFYYNGAGVLADTTGKVNVTGNSIVGNSLNPRSQKGIVIINGHGSTVSNNNVSTLNEAAILVNQSEDTLVSGNILKLVPIGILVQSSNGTIIEQNTVDRNTGTGTGILCSRTNNTTISGNVISILATGLSLEETDNTTIFNNYFKNHLNVEISGSSRTSWNITPVPGPNIIDGPSLGGNYWADSGHTGWSQTNPDTDGDGFTDLPYLLEAGDVDQHPLSIPGEAPPAPSPAPKPPVPEPDNSVPVSLIAPDLFAYRAGIVAESFPDQVCAGSQVPVSVTVRVDGNATWFPGGVGLGAYNDAAESSGPAYTPVGDLTTLSPGQQCTFQFTFTAPTTPGTYTFQYRMQKSDGTWFGDICTIVMNVVDCSGTKGTKKSMATGSNALYSVDHAMGQPGLVSTSDLIAGPVPANRFSRASYGGSSALNELITPKGTGSAYYAQVTNNISGKYT